MFLPGESQGQRRLVGYNPWGLKELNRTERLTQSTVTHRSKDRTHHDILLGLSRNESVLWPTDSSQIDELNNGIQGHKVMFFQLL